MTQNELFVLANDLPDQDIAHFHAELVDIVAHDERSYGPTPFTEIVMAYEGEPMDNPKQLLIAIVNQAPAWEQTNVAKHGFDYMQGILEEFFPHEVNVGMRTIPTDISEDDLPF